MSALITASELPKWVPGQVLCASDHLGWNGVGLRSYHYAPSDVEVPPLSDFVIVSYRRGATHMARRVGGAWTKTQCGPGDISLLTRSQSSHWHWTDDIDVSHVYLSEALVSKVSNEMMDRSVAEVNLADVLKTQDPVVTGAVQLIAAEASGNAIGGALYVEAVATQLVVHLLRHYATVTLCEDAGKGHLSPTQVRRITEYVASGLQDALSLGELAGVAGLGVWSFSRRFRESFGCAAHSYVVGQRVQRAQRLLGQGGLSVKEVASQCGFADQAHMTRVFQASLHTTPAALRRNPIR